MEKVKLPHDVAQAIEQLRGMDFEVDNRSIITAFCNNDYDGYPALVKYAGTNFNDLLKALVNGYEVEETPEDKVREYYYKLNKDAIVRDSEKYAINHARLEMQGIMNTLNLLNIKIEGIN